MKSKLVFIIVLRFILLILAQVFIFNKINLGGYLNPMVYLMFILLLPFEIPKNLVLVISFVLGLSIDLFTGSIGLHAGAATFMAFMRPLSFRLISSGRDFESGILPGIGDLGYVWFISYTLFLTFFHQLFYFTFESFSFSDIGIMIFRIIINTLLTTILIVLIDLLFKPQVKRK